MFLGKIHGYKVYVYSGDRDNLDYFVYRDWIILFIFLGGLRK